MNSPVQIAPHQLARLIGTPTQPIIIDVRLDEDFDAIPFMVPGAFRHSHTQIDALVQRICKLNIENLSATVICHKGLKLSEGVAASLRCHGITAEVLKGGMVGWVDDSNPTINPSKTPKTNDDGSTLWVTRVRPKVDRIACPWLIRRFIDPNAKFLFVTASTVMDVADRFNATPFDMEDTFWGHRGDQCTFDTMLDEWALDTKPLRTLATIVRGADTNRHDLAPEAAGLLAASLGLSRMYRDDLKQLDAGLHLYDAFYRWARDASDEQHDWPGRS